DQLGEIEPRPAADVEDPLAGLGGQRLTDEPAPTQNVGGVVHGLDATGGALVEVQGRVRAVGSHRRSYPFGGLRGCQFFVKALASAENARTHPLPQNQYLTPS